MNKVFLMGNLSREPELKQTQSGKSYVRTAIAVNRPFSKNKEVDFFNLLAWNQTAVPFKIFLQRLKGSHRRQIADQFLREGRQQNQHR